MEPWSSSSCKPVSGWRSGRAAASPTTSGLALGAPSPTEFTLGHNVSSKAEVDAVMQQASNAGAIIVKPAQETFWGGYAVIFKTRRSSLGGGVEPTVGGGLVRGPPLAHADRPPAAVARGHGEAGPWGLALGDMSRLPPGHCQDILGRSAWGSRSVRTSPASAATCLV